MNLQQFKPTKEEIIFTIVIVVLTILIGLT